MWRSIPAVMLSLLCAADAFIAGAPLSHLTGFAANADATRPLTLGLFAVSVSVIGIVPALFAGALRGHARVRSRRSYADSNGAQHGFIRTP
jgi:hypothetical protein